MYKFFFKRLFDLLISFIGIIILSPIFILLIILGTLMMKGNPFFVQERLGYREKNFKLIKFRTMSNAKDENGNLLSNEIRLNKYGRFLRSTSLDELPELFNIFIGDMAIVGPRPLLVEYKPYYLNEEHKRHNVRPGLTGLAQVNGRNVISSWEERFAYDLEYVMNYTFLMDLSILVKTIMKVVKKSDILDGSNVVVGRLDEVRGDNKQCEN